MSKVWDPVAIIGLQVRLPDAETPWQLIKNLEAATVSLTQNGNNCANTRGLIANPESFDAEFFNVPASEAMIMDPQHRILLELAYQAMEVAGIKPKETSLNAGVFASCSANIKHWLAVREHSDDLNILSEYHHLLGNDKDFLATRIAYKLDLQGPALTVQSGCSSSLLALHMACRSLQVGECDVALVGGVSITMPIYQEADRIDGMIFSTSGSCRPYAADADGTLGGMGAAVVVIKRLEDAVAAGDDIWGVIEGSAINNDGSRKVSFSAPAVDSQVAVMRKALSSSGHQPEQVLYIEGHGTGTKLGDALELTALNDVYNQNTDSGSCYLGSIKANIGHLDAASGLVGFIKALFALRLGKVFPEPKISALNPLINHPESRLKHCSAHQMLPSHAKAAVSSLGVGGTNVHMILGRYVHAANDSIATGAQLWFPFAASSEAGLQEQLHQFAEALPYLKDASLADIAANLQYKVTSEKYRCSFCANSLESLKAQIAHASIQRMVLLSDILIDTQEEAFLCHEQWLLGFKVLGVKPQQIVSLPAKPFKITLFPSPANQEKKAEPKAEVLSKPSFFTHQEALIACWNKVLGLEGTPLPDDNFFAKGGDSLLGVSLVKIINNSLGLSLSPVLLFDYPSFGALKQFIQNQQDQITPVEAALETYTEL